MHCIVLDFFILMHTLAYISQNVAFDSQFSMSYAQWLSLRIMSFDEFSFLKDKVLLFHFLSCFFILDIMYGQTQFDFIILHDYIEIGLFDFLFSFIKTIGLELLFYSYCSIAYVMKVKWFIWGPLGFYSTCHIYEVPWVMTFHLLIWSYILFSLC